ncbi:MAG: hypothetical protein ACYCW6_25605 [Candidatus Xenobia bacterium]
MGIAARVCLTVALIVALLLALITVLAYAPHVQRLITMAGSVAWLAGLGGALFAIEAMWREY